MIHNLSHQRIPALIVERSSAKAQMAAMPNILERMHADGKYLVKVDIAGRVGTRCTKVPQSRYGQLAPPIYLTCSDERVLDAVVSEIEAFEKRLHELSREIRRNGLPEPPSK